jgi:uncharacterized protein
MGSISLYVLLGLFVGFVSGFVGIGGGIIVVPILVYLFKLSQQQAQGTTLAMLVPPIGILAAWTYYQQGYVNVQIAAFACLGFVVGSYFGARLATGMSSPALERIFGVFLLLVAVKMIVGK